MPSTKSPRIFFHLFIAKRIVKIKKKYEEVEKCGFHLNLKKKNRFLALICIKSENKFKICFGIVLSLFKKWIVKTVQESLEKSGKSEYILPDNSNQYFI